MFNTLTLIYDDRIVPNTLDANSSMGRVQSNSSTAGNRNEALYRYIQRHTFKRFIVWGTILHMFELMISPIVTIRSYELKTQSQTNSCFSILLGWSIGMIARLPVLIAIEAIIMHEAYRRSWMVPIQSSFWYGAFKFVIIFQIVWCLLGVIGIGVGERCAREEKILFYWNVSVMSLNYVVMCMPWCSIIVQLALNCIISTEHPPVDDVDSETISDYKQIRFIEEKEECKTAQNTTHLQCCICMCEYKNTMTQRIAETGCNHRFHRVCLSDWYMQKQTCPICKSRLQWPLLV